MEAKQDMKALAQGLEGGLRDYVQSLIDGTVQELDGPIRQTAGLMAQAAAQGRMDLVEMARDQLALIMVEKKVRAKGALGHVMDRLLLQGMNLLVNGAIAGLSSVRL